ncbi:MAG: cytochrome-c peroxidase, partial [Sphingobacteriales bacterium]
SMKKLYVIALVCVCWTALAISCKKTNSLVVADEGFKFVTPANFPAPSYKFINNAVTQSGFELGKRLFFDRALSVNNSISCASCHQPEAAFANRNRAVSIGILGCVGTRNAFPIFNIAWQTDFMWDGSITDIERSALIALTSSCEMGNTVDKALVTLRGIPVYPELFRNAFGTSEITEDRFFKALTQFTSMMISSNSKYDKFVRGENGGTLTADEMAGYNLFFDRCSSCHTEPLFTDHSFRNNGLDLISADAGREVVTKNAADRGKFRIPTLRNIEVTGPYMHDGRFNNLQEVLDFYSNGVRDHVNLDPQLKKNAVPGLTLNRNQKDQIIAFLRTLTDNTFLNDTHFRP